MAGEGSTHELGLFAASEKRRQPRDARGSFVRVRYTPHRLKVLEVARQMRVALGLPPSPWLDPFGASPARGTPNDRNPA